MTFYDLEIARQDHFSLFGLPRTHALDAERLETVYRDIQARVHPDKHAHQSDTEKRMAMQWAAQANEAYRTLKDPLARARYLLQLAGHDVALESNTAMPTDFLVAQMELREQVAEVRAAGDVERLDAMHRRLRKEIRGEHEQLREALDSNALDRAAALVRQLMFQEKLFQEVDDALAQVEA